MLQASNSLIYWLYIYLLSEYLAEIKVASKQTHSTVIQCRIKYTFLEISFFLEFQYAIWGSPGVQKTCLLT